MPPMNRGAPSPSLVGMDPRPPESSPSPLHVIVYGGDIAALETALALRRLCCERCELTLVSPVRDLPVRTQAAGAPAAEGRPARFDLGALAAEHGLGFRSDAIVAVDDEAREARTITGNRIPFDALVVAFGARPRGAIPGVTTCWGAGDAGALDALLDELRLGTVRRVAFAMPRGDPLDPSDLRAGADHGSPDAPRGPHRERAAPRHLREPRGRAARPGRRARSSRERLADAGIELVDRPRAGRVRRGFARCSGPRARSRWTACCRCRSSRAPGSPGFPATPRASSRSTPSAGCRARIGSGPPARSPRSRCARRESRRSRRSRSPPRSRPRPASTSSPRRFAPSISGLLSRPGGEHAATGTEETGSATLWWPPEQLAGEHLSAHIGGKVAVSPPTGGDSIEVEVELGPDGTRLAGSQT